MATTKYKKPGLKEQTTFYHRASGAASNLREELSPWDRDYNAETELDRAVKYLSDMYYSARDAIGSGKGTIGFTAATKLKTDITWSYYHKLGDLKHRLAHLVPAPKVKVKPRGSRLSAHTQFVTASEQRIIDSTRAALHARPVVGF